MAKKEEISHKGRILSVTPDVTVVEIVSKSACSLCHASSVCTLADIARKEIIVDTNPCEAFVPGDEVDVVMHRSMGGKAVWIAYVIPLVILLALVLALLGAGFTELFSGIAGVIGVLLYFLIIWLFRGRLSSESAFYVRRP